MDPLDPTEKHVRRTIIELMETEVPGGFVSKIAFSFQHPAADPDGGMIVTDYLALALIDMARTMPPALEDSLKRFAEMMAKAEQAYADGASAEDAVVQTFKAPDNE